MSFRVVTCGDTFTGLTKQIWCAIEGCKKGDGNRKRYKGMKKTFGFHTTNLFRWQN